MKKIVIIGGRGTAVIIAEQIYDANKKYNMDVEVLGFAIDDESYGGDINGFPILCKTREVKDKFKDDKDVFIIYSLYRPDIMKERIDLRDSYGIPLEKFYTFIHPTATICRSAKIGYGNVILANVVVNTNAKVGNFNTINSGALIGHDSTIGDSNYFAAQSIIGSNLVMGMGNFIGLNSGFRNFIKVEDYNIIAMGANIVKSIGSNKVLVGNPARERGPVNGPIR